jgi:methionyl-tRNA formyltransferase
MRQGAVKTLAHQRGLRLLQPVSLADDGVIRTIGEARPDAMVVAAYGLIVPKPMLKLPRLGCLNIHASLLPRWRGAAPIQRALLAGDVATGITIMQMDEGLDTGPILLQEALPIAAADTAGTLHDRLAALGARLIVRALASAPAPLPQDPALACYAPKVKAAEAEISWSSDAAVIERQVRAFNPAPGAFTHLGGTVLKIWKVEVDRGAAGLPGVVCSADATGIVVACGAGAVRVLELQRAGGRALSAQAFLAGRERELMRGQRLGR